MKRSILNDSQEGDWRSACFAEPAYYAADAERYRPAARAARALDCFRARTTQFLPAALAL
jgi:hypothetical protein